MKMLRVITSMDPSKGGPCQGIRNSIPALNSLGVLSEVVCMDEPNASFLHKDTFRIHAVGQSHGPWAKNERLYEWLEKYICDYDVVIVHGLWQYHDYAVYKAMRNLRKKGKENLPKVYLMPHGMLDPYFQKAEGRKLKAIRNSIYWSLIESKLVNQADGLLFTCEEEMRLAATTFKPYKPKLTLNVSYGIQSPPIQEPEADNRFFARFSSLSPQKYLLFLSRIHEKKGVDILIRSYESVYSQVQNPPKLVIAGPGMDLGYGLSLQKMIDGSEFLKSNVLFPGMLQGAEKWSAFYNCEAFVLPSHQENFGIAVVEALACKSPVIISNKVNIFSEIEEAKAGYICKDDLDGIRQALEMWRDADLKTKSDMKSSAYRLYLDAFTNEAAANKLLQELQKHTSIKC